MLACSGSESIEEEIPLTPRTIDVEYMVLGTLAAGIVNPVVSVTYSNSQGGTEQKNGLRLKRDIDSIFIGLKERLELEGDWGGEIIASYDYFPKDEYLYISAQRQLNPGTLIVAIIVNKRIWKYSTSEGEYCMASANGYYDK